MKRKCILCRSKNYKTSKTTRIISEKLKMFYFGKKEIGFSICKSCGLVFQSPSPSHNEIFS